MSTLLVEAFHLTEHLTMPKAIYSKQASSAEKQLAVASHWVGNLARLLDSTSITATADSGCLFVYCNMELFVVKTGASINAFPMQELGEFWHWAKFCMELKRKHDIPTSSQI
jgi:hypothetical protein